ncbi:MAG: hypothetical protein AAF826_03995 [Pseudomonadota bacterium]
MKEKFIAVVGLLVLAGCATVDAPSSGATNSAASLSGLQIEQDLVGQELRYTGFVRTGKFTGTLTLVRGGKIDVSPDSREKDSGTWRIADNQICLTFDVGLNGQEVCSNVRIEGPKAYGTDIGFSFNKV